MDEKIIQTRVFYQTKRTYIDDEMNSFLSRIDAEDFVDIKLEVLKHNDSDFPELVALVGSVNNFV